ncbi:cas-associated protein-like protein [Camelus ferus]|nr:cas-associated protein-like protein [Camelus ferus]
MGSTWPLPTSGSSLSHLRGQSLEALSGLQKADADRKRDAFMDHLKSKYPQHALALRGQQDRMREQWDFAGLSRGNDVTQSSPRTPTRSSRHTQGAQPGLADQAAKLSYASAESLETMSEAELPLGFSRMNRFRQSLPLSRSASQTKLRSPGVLFLQFGEETRRVHITHEVSSLDTLHALIAHMFPQKLTMGMLKSPNTAILIKDEARNVFYELEDVRDIQDRSIIKIYRKEPLYAAFPGSHLTNGDLRSFRKDSGSSSVFAESPGGKTRSTGGSSTAGAPPPELFPGPGERPLVGFGSPVPAKDTETREGVAKATIFSRERMEAMEKQIASLTGLVQSALLRGSEPETPSEKIEGSNGAATPSAPCGSGSRSSGATPVSGPPPPSASSTPAGQPTAINRLQMQLHLRGLQNSTNDLRSQLQQLRKLQLQNLESLRALLKGTEAELSMRVSEAARRQEDPLQRQRTLVEEERLRYLNDEELITQQLNDLEKSVEKIQRDVSHNHRLVPGPELEEKALVLKQLGETLTELKAHFPGLQSKMRVVLRVEVEAVKFLKEEPQRLDGLLKRCRGVTDTLAQIRRQVDEGVWPPPSNLLNQSPKKVTAETDFNKSLDFEMPPPSPPLNLHELSGPAEGAPPTPKAGNPTKGLDAPGKRSLDKAVSVEAAERDWEEKRAALTQYSAKDINRLLEETQAELLKAIPDLDCASKVHPGPAHSPDHKPPKVPHGQKAAPRTEPSGRRGSDELTVPRYRTEKPSKSPPPPPPRRSFPSSHGLTTTRTGEVVVTSKKDSAFIKGTEEAADELLGQKAESEELEVQKPQVKLRRTVSEVARPASTPPIMASAIKDEDDEDRIIAELEDPGPPGGSALGLTWKKASHIPESHPCHSLTHGDSPPPPLPGQVPLGPRPFCIPRIILTECSPNPPSPPEARLEEPGPRTTPIPRPRTLGGSRKGWDNPRAQPGVVAEASQPRNRLRMEKEGVALKRLGTGGCSPEEGEAGVPCPRGPALKRTQEPSPAESHPEETLKDSGHNQPRSGERKGPRAVGLGCTAHGATAQRMDSLEETLQELEATLSQMGMAPAVGPPGSPPTPPPGPQSGGGSVPPMKVVTPGASRLKAAQGQAGSPDKGKHGKQRAEYMRIQAQQQSSSVLLPSPRASRRFFRLRLTAEMKEIASISRAYGSFLGAHEPCAGDRSEPSPAPPPPFLLDRCPSPSVTIETTPSSSLNPKASSAPPLVLIQTLSSFL